MLRLGQEKCRTGLSRIRLPSTMGKPLSVGTPVALPCSRTYTHHYTAHQPGGGGPSGWVGTPASGCSYIPPFLVPCLAHPSIPRLCCHVHILANVLSAPVKLSPRSQGSPRPSPAKSVCGPATSSRPTTNYSLPSRRRFPRCSSPRQSASISSSGPWRWCTNALSPYPLPPPPPIVISRMTYSLWYPCFRPRVCGPMAGNRRSIVW